jgi:hypothetical protein
MEGAGIMNLPTDVGGPTGQSGLDSYAPLIAAQSTARDMGYPRFTRELLSAGSEIDQAEVQEFLQEIRAADLQPEDLAVLRRVVEAVFNDPNNYPEVRGQLLAEGVPEDILPETFDLEFFLALRIATEEAENLVRESRPTEQEMPMGMSPDMPVEMAEGGIAQIPQMTPIAREMAAMGRNGDTMLAHITPQEAMMLQRMGGSGTINPYTGLPEFFLKKMFKSIGKAVKKFAKSTVGRIVIGVALGAFLGPMATGFLSGTMGVTLSAAAATGISAGIGVFGSSLLAGDGFKNSLRNGLTAGALTYGTAGLMGDFSTPATNAPANFAQGYEQGIANIKAPFQAAADFVRGGPEAAANVPSPGVGPISDAATLARTPAERLVGAGEGIPIPPPDGVTATTLSPQVNTQFERAVAQGRVVPSDFASLAEPPGLIDRVTQGAKDVYTGAKDVFTDYLSPNRPGIQGRSANTIFDELTAKGLPKTADTMRLATETAAKEAPGMITKYLPLVATGISALGLTGNLPNPFEEPKQEPGESYEAYMARRDAAVAKLRQESPEFFGSLAPASYPTQTVQNIYTPPTDYTTRSNIPIRTYQAAKGSGPEGVEDFPRKTGPISGPGTSTSDDIPAMLSDGEFVFTAKAVRNMGGGSRRKGAAKMYKLMKMLEGGPVDKTARA